MSNRFQFHPPLRFQFRPLFASNRDPCSAAAWSALEGDIRFDLWEADARVAAHLPQRSADGVLATCTVVLLLNLEATETISPGTAV